MSPRANAAPARQPAAARRPAARWRARGRRAVPAPTGSRGPAPGGSRGSPRTRSRGRRSRASAHADEPLVQLARGRASAGPRRRRRGSGCAGTRTQDRWSSPRRAAGAAAAARAPVRSSGTAGRRRVGRRARRPPPGRRPGRPPTPCRRPRAGLREPVEAGRRAARWIVGGTAMSPPGASCIIASICSRKSGLPPAASTIARASAAGTAVPAMPAASSAASSAESRSSSMIVPPAVAAQPSPSPDTSSRAVQRTSTGAGRRREVLDQVEHRRLGPVQVLEHDDQRSGRRRRLASTRRTPQKSSSMGYAASVRPTAAAARSAAAASPPGQRVELGARRVVRIVVVDARELAERLGDRPERDPLAVREAAAAGDGGPPRRPWRGTRATSRDLPDARLGRRSSPGARRRGSATASSSDARAPRAPRRGRPAARPAAPAAAGAAARRRAGRRGIGSDLPLSSSGSTASSSATCADQLAGQRRRSAPRWCRRPARDGRRR